MTVVLLEVVILILSYMVLDSKSFLEVKNRAEVFNTSGSSKQVLNPSYSEKISNNSGYVYAFVIEKAVAEIDLELPLSKSFFTQNPLLWTTIFITTIISIYGVIRIFIVRKKVKLL